MSPVDRSPLRLLSFPQGSGAWRLDWFGGIAYPDSAQRRRQPSVLIYWSPIDEKVLDEPLLLQSSEITGDTRGQQGCWISVGMLPFLRIGDVWRDGELLFRPDYQIETFDDLHIDGITTTLVKAGLNKDGKGFLLPLPEHPWHRQSTQSYCLEVLLEDGRRLLIPCLELIRFYFGSSSKLINRLFTPPLAQETLYVDAAFDQRTGRLVLELTEGMSGASAEDVGRIQCNPVARRAARLIGSSLLKGAPNSTATHPQAIFPFEGKTTLVAAGKWLSYAGEDRKTFAVFNLRSCSHPFPFESLRYGIKSSAKGAAAGGGRGGARFRAKSGRADPSLVEQDPAKSLAAKRRSFRDEHRFEDLRNKLVWRQKTLPGESGSGSRPEAASLEGVSVGEPDREKRIRAVDLVVAIRSEQILPDFLQATVRRLKRLRRLRVTLLTASAHDGWTVPITVVHDLNGETDPRLFMPAVDGEARLRRVSAFDLQAKNRRYCLLLIEADPIYRRRRAIPTGEDAWRIIDGEAGDFLSMSTQH